MHFTTVDYVIFALLLVASAGIGLFYAFSGGRQRTTQVRHNNTDLYMSTGSVSGTFLVLVFVTRSETYDLFAAGVPDGRPLHELPACFSVAAGHFPVGGGHPGCSVRGLHLRDSVLVPGLLLLLGAAHPSSCFHTSLLQTAPVQRIRGTFKHRTNTQFNVTVPLGWT